MGLLEGGTGGWVEEDGAGPVGGVADLFGVVGDGLNVARWSDELEGRRVVGKAGGSTGDAVREAGATRCSRDGGGDGGEKRGDCGGLHDEVQICAGIELYSMD